jgi:hypothetical protein
MMLWSVMSSVQLSSCDASDTTGTRGMIMYGVLHGCSLNECLGKDELAMIMDGDGHTRILLMFAPLTGSATRLPFR